MQKRIKVCNQSEFDACVKDGNIAVVIEGSVEARGNSSVEAKDTSSVVAKGNVFVRLFSASSIKVSKNVVVIKHKGCLSFEGGHQIEAVEDIGRV